jgi:hypothetical protein
MNVKFARRASREARKWKRCHGLARGVSTMKSIKLFVIAIALILAISVNLVMLKRLLIPQRQKKKVTGIPDITWVI